MNQTTLQEKITDASKTIFSFCMAKTPNREEAEDLSQDILLELLKSAPNLRNDDAFYGFMWAVAGNVYKQWCRKKERLSTCELTDDVPSQRNDFDQLLEDNSDLYLLRRELSLLSEKYRKATILYYIEGKSCLDIASSLSISESMVKYLLFKSRKILKEGMTMERTIGTLSYNPVSLIPLYSGEGPNRFYDFMQSKIRQNIVRACYNDSLTVQQISLETGIPLPYLDDEIQKLEDKQILIRNGKHYQANVIIVTTECMDEMERAAVKYQDALTESITSFLQNALEDYKKISFYGNDFSEGTLKWQLATLLFRAMMDVNYSAYEEIPYTGWGERAFTWLTEKMTPNNIFNYCSVLSKYKDCIYFFDYIKNNAGKGDHHDFYANDRYTNIFCDIFHNGAENFSEYDMEVLSDLIKKGYVVKDEQGYHVASIQINRSRIPLHRMASTGTANYLCGNESLINKK